MSQEPLQRLKELLWARNFLGAHLLFATFCCVVAFLLVGAPLLMTNTLYHDTYSLYSFYRNSFMSILHFGEVRWWDPTIQYGFPVYYFSFLGLYASTPLFWLTELAMYVLHLFGVRNLDMHSVVVAYVALFVPLLFNLAFLSLTRQIFKKPATLILVTIMAAFSPGLIFSVGEVTFEMTAYGLLVASAGLAFFRAPSPTRYLVLNLAVCILLVSFNHLSLYWNPLFLLVFLAALLLFPERRLADVAAEIKALPLRQHVFFAVSVILCLGPTTLCYLDGGDIYRSITGTRTYDPLKIFGGDPLELILAGIPGIGTTRQGEVLPGLPHLVPSNYYLEYVYLGVLTIPLIVMGLILAPRIWRCRLYLLLAFFAVAVLLGGKSGFLSLLYLPDSPLRAVRHFGDTTFRNGLFALMILGAGLGFETITTVRTRLTRKIFLCLGLFWMALIGAGIATVLVLAQSGKTTADVPALGFAAVLVLFHLPLILRLALKPAATKPLMIMLVVMIFLDLSGNMYLFVRNQILRQAHVVRDDSNPFAVTDPKLFGQENSVLVLKDIAALKTTSPGALDSPYLGWVGPSGTYAIPQSGLSAMTYNTMEIALSVPENARLFWRDSWFKGWRATVNGREVAIEKHLDAFKSVPIGPGTSKVRFEFFPWPFACSLLIGWGTIIALTAVLVSRLRTASRAS